MGHVRERRSAFLDRGPLPWRGFLTIFGAFALLAAAIWFRELLGLLGIGSR